MKVQEINLTRFVNLEKGLQKDFWATGNLLLELITPTFTISEIGITHRWITHWDKQGLIDNRRQGTEWRRFSFVEYIWLRIITRLRDFNMPLSTIKQVKKFLFQVPNAKELNQIIKSFSSLIDQGKIEAIPEHLKESFEEISSENFVINKKTLRYFNFLFMMILSMLSTKKSYCLVITDKGTCSQFNFTNETAIEAGMNKILSDVSKFDFTVINLFRILEEFFDNEKIKENVIEKVSFLSDKEKQILELIRKGDFNELSIKLKNDKEYLIGIKRNKSVDTITGEVSSIINRNKYQKIKLTTQKGKIINVEITDSIKI